MRASPGAVTRRRRVPRTAMGTILFVAACGPPSTLPTPLNVRSRVDTVYYDVRGATPFEWRRSIHENAPSIGIERPYQAQTNWFTRWSYASSRMGRTGCEPVDLTVEAEVRFLMPRIADTTSIAPEALQEWRRFVRALWTHENGHAARALRSAGAEYDALRHVRAPGCAQLGAEARRADADVVARWKTLNRDYDAKTQHGVRQGTFFVVERARLAAIDTTYRDTVP